MVLPPDAASHRGRAFAWLRGVRERRRSETTKGGCRIIRPSTVQRPLRLDTMRFLIPAIARPIIPLSVRRRYWLAIQNAGRSRVAQPRFVARSMSGRRASLRFPARALNRLSFRYAHRLWVRDCFDRSG